MRVCATILQETSVKTKIKEQIAENSQNLTGSQDALTRQVNEALTLDFELNFDQLRPACQHHKPSSRGRVLQDDGRSVAKRKPFAPDRTVRPAERCLETPLTRRDRNWRPDGSATERLPNLVGDTPAQISAGLPCAPGPALDGHCCCRERQFGAGLRVGGPGRPCRSQDPLARKCGHESRASDRRASGSIA